MISNLVSNKDELVKLHLFWKVSGDVSLLTLTEFAIPLLRRCMSITRAKKHHVWLISDMLSSSLLVHK